MNPDLYYTDKAGGRNTECLTLGVDDGEGNRAPRALAMWGSCNCCCVWWPQAARAIRPSARQLLCAWFYSRMPCISAFVLQGLQFWNNW